MSYPTTAPSYAASDNSMTLATFGHLARHQQMEADIVALAAKLGTGASTATANTVLRGTGAGTTAYGQVALSTDVTGTLPVASGGTGATAATGTGNVVLANSPTIVTPTVASFTNANHDHTNAAGGGTLGASALNSGIISSNHLASSIFASARVETSQSTTSTSFTDLATVGPEATITVGSKGILLIGFSSYMYNSGADFTSIGFVMSGANVRALNGNEVLRFKAANNANDHNIGTTIVVSGLAAGSTTITLKYSVSGGTGTFSARGLWALAL